MMNTMGAGSGQVAGDGAIQLIETMRVDPGRRIALLPGHLRRLEHSARALGYPWPGEQIGQAIRQSLSRLAPEGTYRLRLLLDARGGCLMESGVLPPTPEPVRLRLAPEALVADPFWLAHKTTRRDCYTSAQVWLSAHPDYFDVVYCNAEGHACEGSRSNLYVQDETGVWLTPPVSSGLLPGVMRQRLLDEGRAREAVITRRMLCGAQALRVSNALRGWLTAHLGEG